MFATKREKNEWKKKYNKAWKIMETCKVIKKYVVICGWRESEQISGSRCCRIKANCQIFVYVITFGLMVQFMDFSYSISLSHSSLLTKWHRLKYKTKGNIKSMGKGNAFHHNRGSLIFQHKRRREERMDGCCWANKYTMNLLLKFYYE